MHGPVSSMQGPRLLGEDGWWVVWQHAGPGLRLATVQSAGHLQGFPCPARHSLNRW